MEEGRPARNLSIGHTPGAITTRGWPPLTLLWGVIVKYIYPKDHFAPARIPYDPAFQDLNKTDRKLYLLLCRRSYLTKRSPHRRYCEWTYKQLGKQIDRSRSQVKRIMKRLMENMLIYRWYAGDSGSNTSTGRARPPRYEIPASRGMVKWWRRTRKIHKTTFHNRKEVDHEKNEQRVKKGSRAGRRESVK